MVNLQKDKIIIASWQWKNRALGLKYPEQKFSLTWAVLAKEKTDFWVGILSRKGVFHISKIICFLVLENYFMLFLGPL